MSRRQLEHQVRGDDVETRFAQALVRLLKYFNLLDRNVGLAISFLENPSDAQASYPTLAKMTAEQKLDRLRKLLLERRTVGDSASTSDLERCIEHAHSARSIRNRYIHGDWSILPVKIEKRVVVEAPPWMHVKLGSDAREEMSLADLESVVDELEGVFQEFMRIRRKHNF